MNPLLIQAIVALFLMGVMYWFIYRFLSRTDDPELRRLMQEK